MRLSLLLFSALFILPIISACAPRQEITASVVAIQVPNETGPPIEVYFCPRDNCSQAFLSFLENASSSLQCALYDLDIPVLIDAFNSSAADVKLVIDGDNRLDPDLDFIRYDTNSQLSHNKFCIIDGSIVLTGSFNPTVNDDTKNNNNLVILYSKSLATNYEAEFQELWQGNFGKGSLIEYPKIVYNGNLIENYFCPEDSCEEHVISALSGAKESIRFMVFSFTSDAIGDALIKSNESGISVTGYFEKSQNNDYCEYPKLKAAGLDVYWEELNKAGKLHHKVFIIDDDTVITGSYNPTQSGDSKNDENVIILHDKSIASLFLEEFQNFQNIPSD